MNSWLPQVLLCAGCFIAGVLLATRCNPHGQGVVERVTHDTAYVVSPPTVITKTVARTIRRTDTVERIDTVVRYVTNDSLYCSPRFVATLDTVAQGDTMHVAYMYPESFLTMSIKRKPAQIITVTVDRTVAKPRPLWLDVLTHVGAFGLGMGAAERVR